MRPSNSRVLITGGAGFLGQHLIHDLYEDNEITVFSRDEAKHYYLQRQYPQVKCIVGDIRNRELLFKAARNIDYAIFAASLKQINACDQNPEEATQIIIQGALNSKNAAIENKLRAAAFISTDKSRAASTIYGALKFAAGESFIIKNSLEEDSATRLTSIIYGNVLNSTGSIIPLIWKSIADSKPLILYHPEMTRFIITASEAISLVYCGLDEDGCNLLPHAQSCRIIDLFEIYKEKFGLEYELGVPRVGEKLHEVLASCDEISRIMPGPDTNYYKIYPAHSTLSSRPDKSPQLLDPNMLNSQHAVVRKSELYNMLSSHQFYQP